MSSTFNVEASAVFFENGEDEHCEHRRVVCHCESVLQFGRRHMPIIITW